MSAFMTLAEAARNYGTDPESLIGELHAAVAAAARLPRS